MIQGLVRLGVVLVAMAGVAGAQAPAAAPAGSTGICKDGSYTKATSKMAACFGHKGVQTWYAGAPSAMPAPVSGGSAASVPAPKSSTTSPAAMPAPRASTTAPAAMPAPTTGPTMSKKGPAAVAGAKTQAAGGQPGLVWLNTSSNVYHCYGTTYYGKTKEGSYMTEAEAKGKGAHGNRGATCAVK